jgi:hypothetical protein
MLASTIAAVKHRPLNFPRGLETMRRATLLVAAAILATLVWWRWPSPPVADPGPARAAAAADAQWIPQAAPMSSPAVSVSTKRDDAAVGPASTPTADYRARFRAAGDYLEFAQQVLPAARAGDAAAQFYLSSALGYCESLYEWYFVERSRDGRVRHRTLDEAQQITTVRPYFTADDVRDIQSRCQRLRSRDDAPFGAANQWFDAALTQGYPLAQANAAFTLAVQSSQRGDIQKVRIAREEARRLAFDSLRDGDVEAMMQTGEVGAYLAGEGSAQAPVRRWSWLLAASLRGGDSPEMLEWMRMACRIDTQCQPYEAPADVIRRKAGNDLGEVERRAREINEKIESGSLTESDIG